MNYRLIAYAQDFTSFLFEKIGKDAEKINQIILFGSVTRGEATKESDVDLFIDTDEKLEKKINLIKEKFYKSIKAEKYWKLLNVNNEINCSIGELENWSEVKRSLISDGFILFGKYKGKVDIRQYYLFVVGSGKDRNKSLSVWRKLYGYTQKIGNKKYSNEGLIRKYNGRKIARGVFIIPIEHVKKISSFLKQNKFKFELIPFWSEGK